MKVSPVSFGSFTVHHIVEKKSPQEVQKDVCEILEKNGFEYNDQTAVYPEYIYKINSNEYVKESTILNREYYSNGYKSLKPRVYATDVINKETKKEELFLTGQSPYTENEARKVLEKHGYYCNHLGYNDQKI